MGEFLHAKREQDLLNAQLDALNATDLLMHEEIELDKINTMKKMNLVKVSATGDSYIDNTDNSDNTQNDAKKTIETKESKKDENENQKRGNDDEPVQTNETDPNTIIALNQETSHALQFHVGFPMAIPSPVSEVLIDNYHSKEIKLRETRRLLPQWCHYLPTVVQFLSKLSFFKQFQATDEFSSKSALKAFATCIGYKKIPAYGLFILEDSTSVDQSLLKDLTHKEDIDNVFVVVSGSTLNIEKLKCSNCVHYNRL